MLLMLVCQGKAIVCDDKMLGASDVELHARKLHALASHLSLKLGMAVTRVFCYVVLRENDEK